MNAPHPTFDADWHRARMASAYQPYFCEENVWRLLADGVVPEPAAALFITNRRRTVAMWGQRAATRDPIVWDYHVVALSLAGGGLVLDLDDRERAAWPLAEWLAHAFPVAVAGPHDPRFRIVPREPFLERFCSDRSHMRDAAGLPLQPFPAWPAPFDPQVGMTLPRFLDLDDPIAGTVTDRPGLLRLATARA